MHKAQKGYGLGGVFRGAAYQKGHGLGGVFRGASFQRGYGLGGVMSKVFNWLKPFLVRVKDNLLPSFKSTAKNVGQEVLTSATNIAQDLLDGKSFQESSEKNINESIDKLTKPQAVSGTINKRRQIQKLFTRKKKRILDIFD